MRSVTIIEFYSLLWIQFIWMYLTGSLQVNAKVSSKELEFECNALRSAASYGLTWISSLNELPSNASVEYSGVGSEADDSTRVCSFDREDLCDWIFSGNGSDWSVTTSLERYYGPVLDYRWERLPEISTDGSEKFQKAIFVGGGVISFSVRASRDAYVLLSSSEDPTTSPTYWIIIGGWKNQRSVIRSCPKGVPAKKEQPAIEGCFHRKQQNEESDVLSAQEWKHFVLSVTPTGQILLNKTDGTQLLNWTDPQGLFSTENTKRNNSFYLRVRTQDVIGYWRIHNITHTMIIKNEPKEDRIRLFSPNLKIKKSNICFTMLHFMTNVKTIPRMGLMFDRQTYLKLEAQVPNMNKGWNLIIYTASVGKKYLGMNASLVISATVSQVFPLALQDLQSCPETGIGRVAILKVNREDVRPNEYFSCLPLPYPEGQFIMCPPFPKETINGVCTSVTSWKNPPCKCIRMTEPCLMECNITKKEVCSPDPKTCYIANGFNGLENGKELDETTIADTEEYSSSVPVDETVTWITTTETVPVSESSLQNYSFIPSIQNLTVTAKGYSWLNIRWLLLNKSQSNSTFIISWWKTIPNEASPGKKWEQILEVGPQTMCPKEWENYYCTRIWHIEPKQNYTISVKIQNEKDEMNMERSVTSETLEVPWGPSHILVTNRSDVAVTLTWGAKLPKNYSQPIKFSLHYRLSQIQSEVTKWAAIDVPVQNMDEDFTFTVNDLVPASSYEFCIHLNNSQASSEEKNNTSYPIEIKGSDQLWKMGMDENRRSSCTYTRTLPVKPFIQEYKLLYKTCDRTNLSVTIDFSNSTIRDHNSTRAYFLCLANLDIESNLFDPNVGDELREELNKEFYIAAELKTSIHNEMQFTFGDGMKTEGNYGNFSNKPLDHIDASKRSKLEILLVAIAENRGDRRYSWILATLPPKCTLSLLTIVLAASGGVILTVVILGIIRWIQIRKGNTIKRKLTNWLGQINVFCFQRENPDKEWTDIRKRRRNSMHLEPIPIEPDDQLEYSSDSGHESTLG